MYICKTYRLLKKDINKLTNVLQLALHAGIIVGCVMLSGDLGSALVFMAIIGIMLFCSGLSIWYFIILFLIIAIAAPFLWTKLGTYQQMRILAGFDPTVDPEKYGYQALHSRRCIISGGFRGAGLFGGTVYTTLFANFS